ncbi:MAG: phosphoribosyltransferase family protein [Pseudomonadota bacterium]
MFEKRFRDRAEAGEQLAEAVASRGIGKDALVYALPRGGVPIATAVAGRIGARLDILFVRKLGVPHQPELAFGAVMDGVHPEVVLNPEIVEAAGLTEPVIEAVRDRELEEIERRREHYLADHEPVDPRGRTCIVVDDGLATGATAKVALHGLRSAGAAQLILAVPVAPVDTLEAMAGEADEIICLETPRPFYGVGAAYQAFPQLRDVDVIAALERAKRTEPSEAP